MKVKSRNVSPHDIIYLRITTTRGWNIMLIGDQTVYEVTRTLVLDFLRALKVNKTTFLSLWENDRLSFFERRGYSLPDDYCLRLTYSSDLILGVKAVKNIPEVSKAVQKVNGLPLLFPNLYKQRNTLALVLVVLIALYYFFIYRTF